MPVNVKPLHWFGSKNKKDISDWITSCIPWEYNTTYCEVFAGMLGILIAREGTQTEIVNDLDERVINWWRQVRDHPQEFGHLVENTPRSRAEFEAAIIAIQDETLPPIRQALAFHVIIDQGFAGKQSKSYRSWQRKFDPGSGSLGRWNSDRVAKLAKRLKNVQLENKDAIELLEDCSSRDYMVIYCDPPYRDAVADGYRKRNTELDVDKLTQVLLQQQGRVAISGYNDEWDHLKWRREEKTVSVARKQDTALQMREVLWMNYDPINRLF